MEKFTSSNGVVLDVDGGAIHRDAVMTVKGEFKDALRDFFQYERDQELGRWRHNPYLVIYQAENHQPDNRARAVHVLDERTGRLHMRHEGQAAWRETDHELTSAATAYFAAHPAPRPWHDAKPGEVWAITMGDAPAFPVATIAALYGVRFQTTGEGPTIIDPGSESITDARRIWPEVPSE